MQTRSSPSLRTLHNMALTAGMKEFLSLPKAILFKKLTEQYNFDRLLRAEARRHRSADSKKILGDLDVEDDVVERPVKRQRKNDVEKKALTIVNKVDPIMLGALKKHTFKFARTKDVGVLFNVDSLVDWCLTTGDFSDPETRIPFSDDDLQEIDKAAKKAKLNKPSVYEAKKNIHTFADMKFRRDALLGLDRFAGEVITDILNIIETCEPEEAQLRLLTREFPLFADLYRQIREADAEFARQCMAHWRLFIDGPPNCPNQDMYGLIDVAIHFLDVCEKGYSPSSHFSH